MRDKLPGWPILAVAAALIATMAAAVFKAPDIDNALAWMMVGASLLLLGVWVTIVVQTLTTRRELELAQEEEQHNNG